MDSAGDDDGNLTLRAPRLTVSFVVALLGHVVFFGGLMLLPDPKRPNEPLSVTITQSAPPPPSSSTVGSPSPSPPRVLKQPAPRTAPVLPVLPPSQTPPEHRALLPVVEFSPAPAPPPTPAAQTWQGRLLSSLAATAPQVPTGILAPSFQTLDRVAANDARLHDEENEARIQADYGPFFRRGIEALRARWHPDEVLHSNKLADTRRCARQTRITFAVAVIDRDGNILDVELKNPSGCPELDDEAVDAFRRVAQFPHPPGGLFVLPDGTPASTARYPVRFIVTFDGGLRLDWG